MGEVIPLEDGSVLATPEVASSSTTFGSLLSYTILRRQEYEAEESERVARRVAPPGPIVAVGGGAPQGPVAHTFPAPLVGAGAAAPLIGGGVQVLGVGVGPVAPLPRFGA